MFYWQNLGLKVNCILCLFGVSFWNWDEQSTFTVNKPRIRDGSAFGTLGAYPNIPDTNRKLTYQAISLCSISVCIFKRFVLLQRSVNYSGSLVIWVDCYREGCVWTIVRFRENFWQFKFPFSWVCFTPK